MNEKIGKHKGAVETLLHEKKELSRLLQIVNSQLERHLSALEDSGVDTEEFIKEIKGEGSNPEKRANNGQDRAKSRSNSQKRSQSKGKSSHESNSGDRDFSPL